MCFNILMDYIIELPMEIKEIIWSYVDLKKKVWVSKYYYETYHNALILNSIPDFKKYMNYIIIKNHNYIFNIIYQERKNYWQKKWYLHDMTFETYELYLKYKAEQYNNVFVSELIKKENKKTRFKEKKKHLTWRK